MLLMRGVMRGVRILVGRRNDKSLRGGKICLESNRFLVAMLAYASLYR